MNSSARSVLLILDVWNAVKGAELEFGPRARLDFGYLPQRTRALFPGADIRGAAFMSRYRRDHDGDAQQDAIRNACSAVGFRDILVKITDRPPTTPFFPHGTNDTDVDLAVYALTKGVTVDAFVVASGDGDFAPLYSALRERRQHVVVMAYRSTLSARVAQTVDQVIILGEESLLHVAEEQVEKPSPAN